MSTNTRTATGHVSRYGLGLGLLDTFTVDGADFHDTDADGVVLSMPSAGGGVFDVRVRIDGDTRWAQYDTLTQARADWKRARREIRALARERETVEAAREVEAALERLRIVFPEGSTVTTVIRHVSASGMARDIQVVGIDPDDGAIEDYTHLLIRAGLWKRSGGNHGVRVHGCGMDMGYHLVHTLARHLYGDGYALKHRSL